MSVRSRGTLLGDLGTNLKVDLRLEHLRWPWLRLILGWKLRDRLLLLLVLLLRGLCVSLLPLSLVGLGLTLLWGLLDYLGEDLLDHPKSLLKHLGERRERGWTLSR